MQSMAVRQFTGNFILNVSGQGKVGNLSSKSGIPLNVLGGTNNVVCCQVCLTVSQTWMTYSWSFFYGTSTLVIAQGGEIPAQTLELFSGTWEAGIILLCLSANFHNSDWEIIMRGIKAVTTESTAHNLNWWEEVTWFLYNTCRWPLLLAWLLTQCSENLHT